MCGSRRWFLLAGMLETADEVIGKVLAWLCAKPSAVCELVLVLRAVSDSADVDEDGRAVTRIAF